MSNEVQYSHHGGLSDRDLRDMDEERTLWGMHEPSPDGWLCAPNMADSAAKTKDQR